MGSEPMPTEEPICSPTPTPTPEPTPIPTPEPEAEEVEIHCVKNGTGNLDYVFGDGNVYSCAVFGAGETLNVSAEGEWFSALYFCWKDRPGDYDILYPDGTTQTVAGGMLHQVVRLKEPIESVSVAPAYGGKQIILSELSAYTAGKLPAEVQDWRYMGDGEADICLFPAHADDEYVFFGGIIPYYAGELGYNVQVCWMTCHDNDFIRNHELLNALWKGGCVYYPEINYGCMDYMCTGYEYARNLYGEDTFVEYQVRMIRKYRPLVCVGHDENGEYGHGAHILAALSLERAVVEAAEPDMFPDSSAQYGVWDVPKTYIHLYGAAEESTYLDFDLPMEHFGGKTMRDVALECYAEHVSQIRTSTFTVYPAGHPYDASRFGLYSSNVGDDNERKNLFENLSVK